MCNLVSRHLCVHVPIKEHVCYVILMIIIMCNLRISIIMYNVYEGAVT